MKKKLDSHNNEAQLRQRSERNYNMYRDVLDYQSRFFTLSLISVGVYIFIMIFVICLFFDWNEQEADTIYSKDLYKFLAITMYVYLIAKTIWG